MALTIKTDSKLATNRTAIMSLPPNSPPSLFGKLPSPYTCLREGSMRLPLGAPANCETAPALTELYLYLAKKK
jgi:hypothetical protein